MADSLEVYSPWSVGLVALGSWQAAHGGRGRWLSRTVYFTDPFKGMPPVAQKHPTRPPS